MPSSWKYKFYGTALAILLSVYFLLPTFLGLKEKRQALEASGKTAPWYYALLSGDELNLGLDLRGGLYLELEVGIQEALGHQVGFLVSDIKRYVLKDDLAETPITMIDHRVIRVEIAEDKQDAFKTALVNSFGNQAVTALTGPQEIFFEIKSDPDSARKKVMEAVKALQSYKGEVTTTHDKKYLALGFKNEAQKNLILAQLAQPELAGDVVLTEVSDVLYISVGDEYLGNLERDIIEQAATAVRNRIDRYGVAEANVSRQSGDRLVVELPGEKNPDNIINIIKRTGKLEFRIVDDTVSRPDLARMVEDKKKELGITNAFEGEALNKLNDALKADLPEHTEVFFSIDRDPLTKKVKLTEPYLLAKSAQVTGDMLENAKVESQNNQPYVSMTFNKTGTKSFGEVTENNIGKQLAIVLDAVVMSAPVIKSAITGGQAQIELGMGRFETLQKEAQDLVLVLREGALPASLAVASKNVIGPSLGQDAIDSGLHSLLIASLAVIIFMLLYYRTGGVIANVALVLNVLFVFGILCLFQASLSLPGLAGIALTVGMAVDANVIIFERMREERFLGHNLKETIDSGYSNAMSAIIDGNITTFIAGLVLFEFGTGPIKGFATTLMIGIITTMFTAIIVTKLIFEWLVDARKVQGISF